MNRISIGIAILLGLILPSHGTAQEPRKPAAIRQVDHDVHHQPVQPKPDVTVLVTARMPKGTTKATLKLQAVAPGKYVRKSDPAYEKDWTDLPMRDDGQAGDAKAGDGVRIHQRDAELLAGRLAPGIEVVVPAAPHVHVFVPVGSAELDGAGTLGTGDAARLDSEDPQTLNAGPAGAEVLVWVTA